MNFGHQVKLQEDTSSDFFDFLTESPKKAPPPQRTMQPSLEARGGQDRISDLFAIHQAGHFDAARMPPLLRIDMTLLYSYLFDARQLAERHAHILGPERLERGEVGLADYADVFDAVLAPYLASPVAELCCYSILHTQAHCIVVKLQGVLQPLEEGGETRYRLIFDAMDSYGPPASGDGVALKETGRQKVKHTYALAQTFPLQHVGVQWRYHFLGVQEADDANSCGLQVLRYILQDLDTAATISIQQSVCVVKTEATEGSSERMIDGMAFYASVLALGVSQESLWIAAQEPVPRHPGLVCSNLMSELLKPLAEVSWQDMWQAAVRELVDEHCVEAWSRVFSDHQEALAPQRYARSASSLSVGTDDHIASFIDGAGATARWSSMWSVVSGASSVTSGSFGIRSFSSLGLRSLQSVSGQSLSGKTTASKAELRFAENQKLKRATRVLEILDEHTHQVMEMDLIGPEEVCCINRLEAFEQSLQSWLSARLGLVGSEEELALLQCQARLGPLPLTAEEGRQLIHWRLWQEYESLKKDALEGKPDLSADEERRLVSTLARCLIVFIQDNAPATIMYVNLDESGSCKDHMSLLEDLGWLVTQLEAHAIPTSDMAQEKRPVQVFEETLYRQVFELWSGAFAVKHPAVDTHDTSLIAKLGAWRVVAAKTWSSDGSIDGYHGALIAGSGICVPTYIRDKDKQLERLKRDAKEMRQTVAGIAVEQQRMQKWDACDRFFRRRTENEQNLMAISEEQLAELERNLQLLGFSLDREESILDTRGVKPPTAGHPVAGAGAAPLAGRTFAAGAASSGGTAKPSPSSPAGAGRSNPVPASDLRPTHARLAPSTGTDSRTALLKRAQSWAPPRR